MYFIVLYLRLLEAITDITIHNSLHSNTFCSLFSCRVESEEELYPWLNLQLWCASMKNKQSQCFRGSLRERFPFWACWQWLKEDVCKTCAPWWKISEHMNVSHFHLINGQFGGNNNQGPSCCFAACISCGTKDLNWKRKRSGWAPKTMRHQLHIAQRRDCAANCVKLKRT